VHTEGRASLRTSDVEVEGETIIVTPTKHSHELDYPDIGSEAEPGRRAGEEDRAEDAPDHEPPDGGGRDVRTRGAGGPGGGEGQDRQRQAGGAAGGPAHQQTGYRSRHRPDGHPTGGPPPGRVSEGRAAVHEPGEDPAGQAGQGPGRRGGAGVGQALLDEAPRGRLGVGGQESPGVK
jgi:hypothetical protein